MKKNNFFTLAKFNMKQILTLFLLILFSASLYSQSGIITRKVNDEGGYDYKVIDIHHLEGVFFRDINSINFINVSIVTDCEFEYHLHSIDVPPLKILTNRDDKIPDAMLNFFCLPDTSSALGPILMNNIVVPKQ